MNDQTIKELEEIQIRLRSIVKEQIIDELEELRIKLDSIIKRIDYVELNIEFNYLTEAKDMMGMAQLKLGKV